MAKMLGKTGQSGQRTCYCCSDNHKKARRREGSEWKREASEYLIAETRTSKEIAIDADWDDYEARRKAYDENPEGYTDYTSETEHFPGCKCCYEQWEPNE